MWGPPADNPWLSIVLDSVAEIVGHPVPPPGVPGPFSLADHAQLVALAKGAGLADARVEEVAIPFRAPSFEQWWSHTTALAGPLSMVLGGLDDESRTTLIANVRAQLGPFVSEDGYELPGLSLVVSARKP